MKLDETKKEQPAQPKPQIRWGRVNHNYKALRIAAADPPFVLTVRFAA